MNSKLIVIGLIVGLQGFAPIRACDLNSTRCSKQPALSSAEEAEFISKLSKEHIQTFNLMSVEQRQQAFEIAFHQSRTADDAVDQVVKKPPYQCSEGSNLN